MAHEKLHEVLSQIVERTNIFNDILEDWSVRQVAHRIRQHDLIDDAKTVARIVDRQMSFPDDIILAKEPIFLSTEMEWIHSLTVVKLHEAVDPKETEIERMSQYIVMEGIDKKFYLTHWSGKEWVRHALAPTDLIAYRQVSDHELLEVLTVIERNFSSFLRSAEKAEKTT